MFDGPGRWFRPFRLRASSCILNTVSVAAVQLARGSKFIITQAAPVYLASAHWLTSSDLSRRVTTGKQSWEHQSGIASSARMQSFTYLLGKATIQNTQAHFSTVLVIIFTYPEHLAKPAPAHPPPYYIKVLPATQFSALLPCPLSSTP